MKMRRSRVLEKLRAGKMVCATKLNTMDPRVAEIAAMCGFDVLWYCMEHVATDWVTIENVIRAAKIYDVDVMVRVEKGSYSDYIRPFELDAAGIMVPHVMSYDEALQIVKTTRFHPVGRRPIDGGNQDGGYCSIPVDEYIAQANRERFVCIQIEDPEPLDDLDKIAQVDGIDIILFGPADFSQGIGAPGDTSHPKVVETRKRIAEVCKKYGKFAATTGGVATAAEFKKLGFQFLSAGADVVALMEYFTKIKQDFDREISK